MARVAHVLRARRFTGHRALLFVAAVAITGCVSSPAAAAREAQQMNDIGDGLNELRSDNATLASTLDSLRIVLAKHDTTLMRVANAIGVVVVK